MNIKSKLVLYFAILIFIVFSISSFITGIVIRTQLNRLLYNNVITLNESVINYLNNNDFSDYSLATENIKNITGVEIIIYNGDDLISSTFTDSIPNVHQGILASEKYDIWRLRVDDKAYYYTVGLLKKDNYDIYVLRSESIIETIPNNVYFTSLLGVYFFVLAISTVIFYASQSFVNPLRIIRDYANMISPDKPMQPIDKFTIKEFMDLGESMESAWERLNNYWDYQREFLHNFSHEMKTPLTNIYGYTEGIKYNVLNDDEKQKGLDIILKETEHLKNNIDQILLMGRIESDEYVLPSNRINLVNVIGDALNSVQIEATNSGIQLIFLEDKEYYIQGEADRLETAFINILSNGIRYAKSKIMIFIRNEEDIFKVEISDDGIGVPDSEKEKIFERFYIGQKGHNGLGLTISKAIIEKHHGSIHVENNYPTGANFITILPKIKN